MSTFDYHCTYILHQYWIFMILLSSPYSEKRIAEIKKQLMEVHEGNTNRHTEIKCKECVKICNNTKNLRQHMKDTHTKNFPCELCEKSFHVGCKLEDNLKEHDKTKEFKCAECKEEFYLEWRLKRYVILSLL